MTTHDELLAVIDWLTRRGAAMPIQVAGTFRGHDIEATLDEGGTFHWRDQQFSSPSVAAGQIATATTGERTGHRAYVSINGWKFWSVQLPAGGRRSLSELRDGVERP